MTIKDCAVNCHIGDGIIIVNIYVDVFSFEPMSLGIFSNFPFRERVVLDIDIHLLGQDRAGWLYQIARIIDRDDSSIGGFLSLSTIQIYRNHAAEPPVATSLPLIEGEGDMKGPGEIVGYDMNRIQ